MDYKESSLPVDMEINSSFQVVFSPIHFVSTVLFWRKSFEI